MKKQVSGTITVTPEQLKELLVDYVKSIILVPMNHYVEVDNMTIHEYSDSRVEFSIRHDDEREKVTVPTEAEDAIEERRR